MTMKAYERDGVVRVGNCCIDYLRFEVKVEETEIKLSCKEFALLWTLASEDGRAFRRQELIARVWGNRRLIAARTVDVYIARLRTKLEAAVKAPAIETVWGIGYRFRAST
jgi:DNA-binding response OmpR family regulator